MKNKKPIHNNKSQLESTLITKQRTGTPFLI